MKQRTDITRHTTCRSISQYSQDHCIMDQNNWEKVLFGGTSATTGGGNNSANNTSASSTAPSGNSDWENILCGTTTNNGNSGSASATAAAPTDNSADDYNAFLGALKAAASASSSTSVAAPGAATSAASPPVDYNYPNGTDGTTSIPDSSSTSQFSSSNHHHHQQQNGQQQQYYHEPSSSATMPSMTSAASAAAATTTRLPPQMTPASSSSSSINNLVILHVYELQPDPSLAESQQQHVSTTDRALLFMSGLLPTIGMGAYHTSLELGSTGCIYTFVGNLGIVVSKSDSSISSIPSDVYINMNTINMNDGSFISSYRHDQDIGVPNGGKYKQSILLGATTHISKNEIIQIIKNLSVLEFFTPTSYNFINRNCNHFTEVLATSILMTEAPKKDTARLLTYPKWLNRLATTASTALHVYDKATTPTSTSTRGTYHNGNANGSGGGNPCNVLQEARIVAGY